MGGGGGVGGDGTDSKEEFESAHKVNSGEENSPAAPAGNRNHNLSITNPAPDQKSTKKEEIFLLYQTGYPGSLFLTGSMKTVATLLTCTIYLH